MSLWSYFSSERFNRNQILSILILQHPGSQITSNIKNNRKWLKNADTFCQIC